MTESRYEAMRTDPQNWKLGMVYSCRQDPRVIIRQRLPVGWAWNFAHPKVYPAILAAVVAFLGPPALAWWFGVRSAPVILLVGLAALSVVAFGASRMAREPAA